MVTQWHEAGKENSGTKLESVHVRPRQLFQYPDSQFL